MMEAPFLEAFCASSIICFALKVQSATLSSGLAQAVFMNP